MNKKQRLEKQLEEQLHITADRGPTFVGYRPTEFQSKKHPSRAKRKEMERREIEQEEFE